MLLQPVRLAALAVVAFTLPLMLQVRAPQTPQPIDATPILDAAREALGGTSRIAAVQTFSASGRTRKVRGRNLVPIEFEILCALPDKYVHQDDSPAEESGLLKTGFNGGRLIQAPAPEEDEDQAARQSRVGTNKLEFVRLTLGLFATSFNGAPVTFTYAGRAEAPEGAADAIDVKGADKLALRLFVDRDSHLPVMLSWQASAHGGTVEHRLYYADRRAVDGLKLPFQMRHAIAGETVEETVFDRYRLNVKIDPKKFEAVK
jgi:hypothetical protein